MSDLAGVPLSVVIVNWEAEPDLRACLLALRSQTHPALEIIVVDNGSTDGSVAMARAEFPEVIVIEAGENLGFAEGCNRGIARSTSPWVAMLNNDAFAEPTWAAALVRAAESAPARCGMLQSLLLFHDRPTTINSSGIELMRDGNGRDRGEGQTALRGDVALQEIFCPTAGAAAYSRAMLEEIRLPAGYFDPLHFMYFEDMDLGWRARLLGWQAFFVPDSVVRHRYQGSSRRKGRAWMEQITATNRIRMLLKNASLPFLARSSLTQLEGAARVLFHGRAAGAKKLASAVMKGLEDRRSVASRATVARRAIERRWAL